MKSCALITHLSMGSLRGGVIGYYSSNNVLESDIFRLLVFMLFWNMVNQTTLSGPSYRSPVKLQQVRSMIMMLFQSVTHTYQCPTDWSPN